MKYALLSLVVLVAGCENQRDPSRVCEQRMVPALCKVLVSCGHKSSVQVCQMEVESVCVNGVGKATVSEIIACSDALSNVASCDAFSIPKECLQTK
jgi:hypothetical protein